MRKRTLPKRTLREAISDIPLSIWMYRLHCRTQYIAIRHARRATRGLCPYDLHGVRCLDHPENAEVRLTTRLAAAIRRR